MIDACERPIKRGGRREEIERGDEHQTIVFDEKQMMYLSGTIVEGSFVTSKRLKQCPFSFVALSYNLLWSSVHKRMASRSF